MHDFVQYGRTKIHYKIERTQRKTLGITVGPTGEVLASAPYEVSVERIRDTIIKRGSWIIEQLTFFSKGPVLEPEKRGLSGESFYFLGRQYRLKVIKSDCDEVKIKDDRIILNCLSPKREDLKLALLQKWYFDRAKDIFSDRFQKYKSMFGEREIFMIVKKLKNSWGKYYSKKGEIIFNVELIVAPIDCIDYVIVHELCHGQVLNHGKKFDALMTLKMPNWKMLKMKLDKFSNGLNALFSSA